MPGAPNDPPERKVLPTAEEHILEWCSNAYITSVSCPDLKFALHMSLSLFMMPLLFFLALLPLAVDRIPEEVYVSYLTLITFAGLSHHPFLQLTIFDRGPNGKAWFFVWLAVTISVIIVRVSEAFLGKSIVLFVVAGGHLGCIFLRPLYGLIESKCNQQDRWSAAAHFLVQCLGAVPFALGVALHGTRRYTTVFGNFGYFALAALVWTIAPMVLASLGTKLCYVAYPNQKLLGRLLWIFYIEASFGCFGLAIFMYTPLSAASYAASSAVSLSVIILQGLLCGFRWYPYMTSLALHRVTLLLEAFCALVGRVSAYTIYICFSLSNMAMNQDNQDIMSRYSLVLERAVASVRDINIYRSRLNPIMGPWIGVAGVAVVVSTFVGFLFPLPKLWTVTLDTSEVTPAGNEQCEKGEFNGVIPASVGSDEGERQPKLTPQKIAQTAKGDSIDPEQTQHQNTIPGTYRVRHEEASRFSKRGNG